MMDTASQVREAGRQQAIYDAFVSYSHAADGLLAPRLQAGLQRFAKPWWKRRAVRVFRDESSLSASPHLWSSITEALDRSEWFILLLSPEAARSEWVNQEIQYWKTHRDPSRVLPVVTDSAFVWDGSDIVGPAAPASLSGVFDEEPRWVDLRWAKGETQLSLNDPRFADAIADIASTIRHVPKDDLASEEVRQHRRTVRTAWAAGALVAALAVASIGFAIEAGRNASEAERQAELASEQRDVAEANAAAEAAARQRADASAQLAHAEALAAASLVMADVDAELASLLVIQALATVPVGENRPVALDEAIRRAWTADRLVRTIDTGSGDLTFVDMSADGSRIGVSSPFNGVTMYDSSGVALWTYDGETVDSFTSLEFSPNDERVAVTIVDSSTDLDVLPTPSPETDGLPSRIVVLDASTGQVVSTLEYPDCAEVRAATWRPDGEMLAVTSGFTPCARGGHDVWVELIDTETWSRLHLIGTPEFATGWWFGPWPAFDTEGRLYVFNPTTPIQVYSAATYRLLSKTTTVGIGDVSPDGSVIVQASIFDARILRRDGSIVDRLPRLSFQVREPAGVRISDSGRFVAIGTEGPWTFVFELSSGDVAHSLRTGPPLSIAFSGSEDLLVTSHTDGTFSMWDIGDRETVGASSEELIQQLLERQRRTFNSAECATYRIDPCPTLEELRTG